MTAKIYDITKDLPKARASEDVVKTLERLLDLARQGEIMTLACVGICQDGDALWVLCDADKPQRRLPLIGAIRMIERKLVDEVLGEGSN